MNDLAQTSTEIEFKTLAEGAPVMLWMSNADGEMIYTNSRWKEFIGAENVEQKGGKAWYEALHPDDRERCLNTFKQAFAARRSFEMEYRLKRLDGVYRHMLDIGEPYIAEDGIFSGFLGSSTDVTERKSYEQQLEYSHTKMKLYNSEMRIVNRLNSFLQICRTLEETYPVVEHYARELFPQCTGTVYLLNESRTVVESMMCWGPGNDALLTVFDFDDCWSMRQGKPHVVNDPEHGLVCKHLDDCPDFGYMCVPVIAQGEMVGMIHLQFPELSEQFSEQEVKQTLESMRRLVYMTADNLALALVSLKLREALKSQSIKDPLTGLYNRRYMEECLEREYSRCKRNEEALGVMMLDIDHFKSYNDNYGHDTGDRVLAGMGEMLENSLRKSDIACRYGGEEFILIMPGAPLHIMQQRAEELRADISNLNIASQNEVIEDLTVSIGVAIYPMHADSTENLVRAADEALYEAKHTGRNRVTLATEIGRRKTELAGKQAGDASMRQAVSA